MQAVPPFALDASRFGRIDAAPAWARALALAGLTALACLTVQRLGLAPGVDWWPWPAAGIAFGVGRRWGRRWVVPCAVGAAAAALPTPSVAAAALVGVAIGPLAGLTLLRIAEQMDPVPDRVRSELQWLAASICVTAPIPALTAALALQGAGRGAPTGSLFDLWLAGALGAALVVPLIGPLRARARHRSPIQGIRPDLDVLGATLLLAAIHVGLMASGHAHAAQALLLAFVPIVTVAGLHSRGPGTSSTLAACAALLLAAHRIGGAATGTGDAAATVSAQPPNTGQLVAVLVCAVVVARLMRAMSLERRAAIEELARQAERAAVASALDATGLAAELEDRLRTAPRSGFGLIGVQLAGHADHRCGGHADPATERAVARLLGEHPESLAAARLEPGRHVALVAADSVAQLRATAREIYAQLERLQPPRMDAMARACIGALLIEPAATLDADDCLGALADAIAIAGSVRDPRLFVEPLSQTMVDARRAHRDKADQVRDAIEHARLELHAQPLDDADEGGSAPFEYEILTRLRDRDGNLIAPAEFLPLAAQSGLAGALDRAVLRRVFEWLASHPQALARTARCSINLSEASIADPAFAAHARDQRLAFGIDAGKIVFEIAEGDVLRDPAAAARLVEALKADGFGIALDDFGRGLATFEYLRRFPLDYLKIDGAFIRNLATSPIDEEIVLSIIRIARRLSIRSVAEHVHSDRVLARLRRLGVDHVQGALIGAARPLQEWFDADGAACARAAGAAGTDRQPDRSTAVG